MKDLSKHFTKKDICMSEKHIKRCLTLLAIRESSYNFTEILLTAHYKELKKTNKPWKYQVLVRMQSNWNPHILLVRIQNGRATLEESLVISYKVKCILTQHSHCCVFTLENDNLCLYKNLYTKFITALLIISSVLELANT